MSPTASVTVLGWVLRLTAAAILLQTLFFKFTGADESVYIFRTLGMEPWGRYASGVVELIASLLLLWTPTAPAGALAAMSVMTGAIVSHLTTLGIEVQGDRGLLFGLALMVWTASGVVLWIHRRGLPIVGPFLEAGIAGGTR